jgi:probable HAF family extracellular repeat protein
VINSHAFVWSKQLGKMQDLGVLYNDSISQATGINDQGQIVGVSFPSDRPFIYENGKITDLNNFIDPNSPYLLTGNVDVDINDLGEIVGQACVLQSGVCTATSATPAFILIPTHSGYQLSIGAAAGNAAPSDGKSIEPGALAHMLANRRSIVRFVQVPTTQQ